MGIKTQQVANTAAASINAILSILDGTTPYTLDRTINVSLNPFQFIIHILQRVAGYEKIVSFVTELVVNGLPILEDATKISLLESLKDMFSCSVNPTISEELIQNGVVLNLKTIDLLNIMSRCPLDTENETYKVNGSFFYSDVDNFTIPDELVYCKDLNAVIWYVKHRASDRTVWYGYQNQDNEHQLLTMTTIPSAKDGIITLEYNEKASDVKDCLNNPMKIQVPYNNCLHVFLGNTKGVATSSEPSSDDILYKTNDFRQVTTKAKEILEELEQLYETTFDFNEQNELNCEINVLETLLNAINNGVRISEKFPNMLINSDNGKRYLTIGNYTISMDEYTYSHTKNDLAVLNRNLEIQRRNRVLTYSYRQPQQNYYYHKTLFEFNTDYIKSVKFFDSKVTASQIVNILTGCFGISLNISFEERLIRNEVEKMLSKIIETGGDTTVSDCFFTFSNDEYNLMVDETEKERIGQYIGDTFAYGTHIDYDTIYEELNKISNSATLSEQVSSINHTMNTISRTLKPEIYSESKEWELNFDFLNNMLKGLALSMVYNIVSPKIYMLMAINLKIMGREPNFDLSTFIETFKQLLINVIHGIVDEIMIQLREWLLNLVQELILQMLDRIRFEQSEYYIRLLTQCIRAFAIYFGRGEDWNMADVNYADIVVENNNQATVNTKC